MQKLNVKVDKTPIVRKQSLAERVITQKLKEHGFGLKVKKHDESDNSDLSSQQSGKSIKYARAATIKLDTA